MQQRIEFEPAYILSNKAYQESSALLEVLTPQHGRVGLVARGARSSKSRLRAVLQPFQPLLLSWNQKGELGSLHAAEPAGSAIFLSGEAVFYGWYLNELLIRLLPRLDPHADIFSDYAQTLTQLGQPGVEPVLRGFELRLLAHIGYAIDVWQDWDQAAIYRLLPNGELRLAMPGDAHAISGATLITLRDETWASAEPVQRQEARRLMRQAIRTQLGGRELETPKLLKALRQRVAAE